MSHESYETQQPWFNMATLETVVAAPAVGARSAAAIEALANISIWEPDQGLPSVRFRFRTTIANNSDGVFDMMTVRQNADAQDYYNRAATITVTAGQQVANSGYTFGDTVVVSNVGTNQEIKAVSPTGDYIGELLMNLEGVKKIAFIGTALAGSKILDIDACKGTYKYIFLKA